MPLALAVPMRDRSRYQRLDNAGAAALRDLLRKSPCKKLSGDRLLQALSF